MTDEREGRRNLTDHEVAEKIRARKQRTKWGSALAVVGFAAALAAVFWKDNFVAATLFLAVALVGAGFLDPSTLKAMLRR